MSQRALRRNFLKFDGDCVRFTGANPDWQLTVGGRILQHDNAMLRHQAYANTVNYDLYHSSPSLYPRKQTVCQLGLYTAAWQRQYKGSKQIAIFSCSGGTKVAV